MLSTQCHINIGQRRPWEWRVSETMSLRVKGGSEDKDSVNVLLSTDVLVLLRVAGHLADADSALDVFELQTQVLARDGQHGPSLPGPRLRRQLVGRTNERGHMLAGTTHGTIDLTQSSTS